MRWEAEMELLTYSNFMVMMTMMTNMMITMNTMKKTRTTKVRQERNFLVEAKSMMMMQMMTIHQ